ncbi:MAG: sugar transferase [Dehalococcoidia bacterium]
MTDESLRVAQARDPHPGYTMCKRTLDVAVAVTALCALAPLLGLVALLVKSSSRGPVFFSQERCGLGGSTFHMLKFRTMVADAEQQLAEMTVRAAEGGIVAVDAPVFKSQHDPRVTRIGRYLRRLSIDELPQLVNVLRGEMSLVGPRPLVVEEALLLPEPARVRHAVRPGLTCIWQTSGRSRVPYERRLEMDIEYATRRSLWLDIALLARTPRAVFSSDGAY